MPQSLDEEISKIVRLTANVMDAFTAALFLVDEKKGDVLRLKSYQSLSSSIIPSAEFPVGHGLVGWVAKNGKSTQASNFRGDSATLKFYGKDEDIKSFAASPVLEGDRVIGVLCVDSKQNYVFTEKMGKILDGFAETLSGVIASGKRRIRLNVEAVALQDLADVINKLTSCETIAELSQTLRLTVQSAIAHDQLGLALRSYDGDSFHIVGMQGGASREPLPLHHCRLGWVIQHCRPMNISNDTGVDAFPGSGGAWRSFIAAPMISHQSAVGAIGLVSRKVRAFRQSDYKALQILAAACSSAFTTLYLHNKSRKAKYHDAITNLFTHRYLLEKLASFNRTGAALVVNALNFENVNAKIGHEGGDETLAELARRIKDAVGDAGLACRYYGDKYIVALDGAGADTAVDMMESITRSVEAESFLIKGVRFNMRVSIGAALSPADGMDLEELIAKANIAARVSKEDGKGRLSFFGSVPSPASFKLRSLER
jgi:diguanylate cyclase (GGDEF)-like protein